MIRAESEDHFAAAVALFVEYARSLDFDLCFQDFEDELRNLRDMYGPPSGCLLLQENDDGFVGCVALRRLDDAACEMKRLYINPDHRGNGYGRALAQGIVEEARAMGYALVRLDTIDTMRSATTLYEAMGFKRIEPYCHNPIEGATYYELDLRL